ncbi:MAG: type IV secretion system DNA-binding domain-containing protein [Candidatus Gracilibacteria bacterium]|nr:type IV secretion system DNA-binding domain-containing protein [Candidatus Gracilibacteria bacterium]
MNTFLGNFDTNFWPTLLNWAVFLTCIYIFWKLFVYFARMIHSVMESKQMVFIKVTMPRTDSSKDKEKDNEKDFKEKVALMDSLYRSIYEIQELNLWNRIRTIIWNNDYASFELMFDGKLIHFYIVTHKRYSELIQKQVTSTYGDADVGEVEPYDIAPKGSKLKYFYMYLSQLTYFPIRTFKQMSSDPLNEMANVFSKLKEEDRAAIQVIINPRGRQWNKDAKRVAERLFQKKSTSGVYMYLEKIPLLGLLFKLMGSIFGVIVKGEAPTKAPGASGGDSYVRMLASDEENLKLMGEKANQEGFDTTIRIVASAPNKTRAEQILDAVVLGFNTFSNQGSNWFQNRRVIPWDLLNTPWMHFNFARRLKAYGEKSSILVPEELSSMYHIPSSRYNFTPIIKWLDYKVLPPPTNMGNEGILLGNNVYQNKKTPIYILPKDRTRHMYVIGKSGSGKSALLNFMARQDIAQGNGCCVIDPHGDLIEDCLKYIPKDRVKDVIHFNPADQERPMGLNLLEVSNPAQMDMASSQATEIFIKLFGDEIFGPRIQHYFRNACLTLMEDTEEGATLIDVPRMFVDEEFMKYKVSKVKNPIVKAFWEKEYANTGERERQEMIPYFSSKFGPFITNTIMRNTIGQPKSAFNFREAMDEGKILLINLSKGKMGDLNTQLLGLICVAQLQMAAMGRTDMPEEERRPFYMYVDEFQNFATDSFASILSEARKYKLALILAHQYIGQLTVSKSGKQSTAIRDAVFGNAGTILSFKIGAEDAEYMAKEFAPVLSEQDVITISNYKAYMKLSINNAPSRPFSLETIWDPSEANEKGANIVKEYCRLKYGRKREFVDAEIEARIGIV